MQAVGVGENEKEELIGGEKGLGNKGGGEGGEGET